MITRDRYSRPLANFNRSGYTRDFVASSASNLRKRKSGYQLFPEKIEYTKLREKICDQT